MSGRSWIGVRFALFAVPLLLGAVVLTVAVLRADRAAAMHQRDRLSLWRLDAAVLPLLAAEAARDPADYQSFTRVVAAYSENTYQLHAQVQTPSPLLFLPPGPVLLHCDIDASGAWTSPQVPTGNQRDVSEARHNAGPSIAIAEQRLAVLRPSAERIRALAATLPPPTVALSTVALSTTASPSPDAHFAAPSQPPAPAFSLSPDHRSAAAALPTQTKEPAKILDSVDYEYANRSQQVTVQLGQNVQQAQLSSNRTGVVNDDQALAAKSKLAASTPWLRPDTQPDTPLWSAGAPRVEWVDGHLLLLRRVRELHHGRESMQIAWLNWEELQRDLRAQIRDLDPAAQFAPWPSSVAGRAQNGDNAASDQRRMATLPVSYLPGAPSAALSDDALMAVLVAWIGIVVGVIAAAVALLIAQRLNERRAAFVSAVTHELRTPLTALRLHADVLHADTGDARADTLRQAAARLAHLIDNVLDYARIEHHRAPMVIRESLHDVIAEVIAPLAERLQQAGLELQVEPLPQVMVQVDRAGVQRILVNLIDNAAKYGRGTDPQLPIVLSAQRSGAQVLISVRDHGPGISPAQRHAVFDPFHRGAEAAAGSAPGVGLGLALCQRLARAMGGELTLTAPLDGPGTVAVLTLRCAS